MEALWRRLKQTEFESIEESLDCIFWCSYDSEKRIYSLLFGVSSPTCRLSERLYARKLGSANGMAYFDEDDRLMRIDIYDRVRNKSVAPQTVRSEEQLLTVWDSKYDSEYGTAIAPDICLMHRGTKVSALLINNVHRWMPLKLYRNSYEPRSSAYLRRHSF